MPRQVSYDHSQAGLESDRRWGVHTLMLTRERWTEYREDFAAILDIQQRYEQAVAVSTDGRTQDGGA